MKQILVLLFTITLLTSTSPVHAVDTGSTAGGVGQININLGNKQKTGGIPGIPAVDNPNATPGNIISNVIRILDVVGVLAVLLFIVWGAFDWITAGGDKDKLAGARRKIVNALIGLTLLALSAFIVSVFAQVVGFPNPMDMGPIPTLGEQAKTVTTP